MGSTVYKLYVSFIPKVISTIFIAAQIPAGRIMVVVM